MKIVSRFKDYYDYISHRYGSDPGATYQRGRLPDCVDLPPYRGTDDRSFEKFSTQHYLATGDWTIAFVVVGPLAVPTVSRSWTVDGQPYVMPETVLNETRHADALREDYRTRKKVRVGPFDPEEVKALIRLVGAPVFRIRRVESRRLVLDENTPILKDIRGFTTKYPPEVVWQGIYTTLTSVLREDPDKTPPATVDEKHRIEYAGFDLKTSFRHPVNKPGASVKRR